MKHVINRHFSPGKNAGQLTDAAGDLTKYADEVVDTAEDLVKHADEVADMTEDFVNHTDEIRRPIIEGGSKSGFAYKNNPMDNPKAARDIVENPDAVYGYSPNPESTRIGEFASKIDWTDPDQVAIARQTRQAYHEANEAKLQALYNQGYTTEEIAARMVEERNMSRINSYIKNGDLKGLEIMKKSNLKTYGNELGMTLVQALEKYGSYEEIINATIRSNPGMDACTGLYDIYHGGE